MEPNDHVETITKSKVDYMLVEDGEEPQRDLAVRPGDVEALIEDWPAAPKKVSIEMIERYGPPHEATPGRLLWHGNGPWKRTIVQREEIPHRFPAAHTDFVSQTIDYHVPIEKVGELARFDGSVLVDRTAGEVTARCDNEAMNMLALNLVHDIVTGQRTVDEARDLHVEHAAAYLMHRRVAYTETLQFAVPDGDTADPDESAMTNPIS